MTSDGTQHVVPADAAQNAAPLNSFVRPTTMEKLAAPIFGILTWIVPGITYGALAAAYGLYVNRNYPGFSGIGVAYIVASAVWCAGALAGLTFATISLLRREKYRFLGIIGLIVYILASLFCIGQILLIFFLWVTQ